MLRITLTTILLIVCVAPCDADDYTSSAKTPPENDLVVIMHKLDEELDFPRAANADLPGPPEWMIKLPLALNKHRATPISPDDVLRSVVYAGKTDPGQVIDSPYLIYVWPSNEKVATIGQHLTEVLYAKMAHRYDRITGQGGLVHPMNICLFGEGEGAAINSALVETMAKYSNRFPQPSPELLSEISRTRAAYEEQTTDKYVKKFDAKFLQSQLSHLDPFGCIEIITFDPTKFGRLKPLPNPGGIVDFQTNFYTNLDRSNRSTFDTVGGVRSLDVNLSKALYQANQKLDAKLQARDWYYWQRVLALPPTARSGINHVVVTSPEMQKILYGGGAGITAEDFTDGTSDFFTPHLDAKIDDGSINLTPYKEKEGEDALHTVCSLTQNGTSPQNSVVEFSFRLVNTPDDGIPCEGITISVMKEDGDLSVFDTRKGREDIRAGFIPIWDSFSLTFDAHRDPDITVKYGGSDVLINDPEDVNRFISLHMSGSRSTIRISGTPLPEPTDSGNWFRVRAAFVDGHFYFSTYAYGSDSTNKGSYNANYRTSEFAERMGENVRFFFSGAYKDGSNDQYIRDIRIYPIDGDTADMIAKTHYQVSKR